MDTVIAPAQIAKPLQKSTNGVVHSWYRIALGYSDTLVGTILDRFRVQNDQIVLDPFCGSGTTIVECKKRGIFSIGIDANPSSVFASTVKTNWDIDGSEIIDALNDVENIYNHLLDNPWNYQTDPTYIYLADRGMIKRGWISNKPLKKSIYIKKAIGDLQVSRRVKNALMLALIAEIVYSASNVKFGPQLYCGTAKNDADVISGFKGRAQKIANDLRIVNDRQHIKSQVLLGDARELNEITRSLDNIVYDYIVCSPPYPGEHDYTRHSRLELAFLEEVSDRASLQKIKKNMIRSNTKGIYKADNDKELVLENPEIREIVNILTEKVKTKSHGFARLYPTVVQEYFGGMKRHLANLLPLLNNNAKCAYVLGDQFSYLQVPITTAKLLSSIVSELGYVFDGIEHWRTSWSTKTSKKLDENILYFHKP